MGIVVAATLGVTIGLFAFLISMVEPAEAADMTFTTDTTITTNQSIVFPEKWIVNSGVTLTIGPGVTIDNNGNIDVIGTIDNNGNLLNRNLLNITTSGLFNSNGTINNVAGALIETQGTINNLESGIFDSDGFIQNIPGLINNAGILNTLNMNAGTVNNTGTFVSNGIIESVFLLNNDGNFTNNDTIHSNGQINNSFFINNPGIIDSNRFTNTGIINNTGSFSIRDNSTNYGEILNTFSLSVDSFGILNNIGSIDNFGFFANRNTINNFGNVTNYDTIVNFPTGFINNTGLIDNKCGAVFDNRGTLTGIPVDFEECIYNLNLFEGADPSDLVLDLGQEATAIAQTDDPEVSQVVFTWLDPSSAIAKTEIVPIELGSSSHPPDQVGTWTVVADFGNGEVIQQTLDIDFMVIPESPIGLLALMGSSFAALGGFALLRRRHGNNNPHSIGDRGI